MTNTVLVIDTTTYQLGSKVAIGAGIENISLTFPNGNVMFDLIKGAKCAQLDHVAGVIDLFGADDEHLGTAPRLN